MCVCAHEDLKSEIKQIYTEKISQEHNPVFISSPPWKVFIKLGEDSYILVELFHKNLRLLLCECSCLIFSRTLYVKDMHTFQKLPIDAE